MRRGLVQLCAHGKMFIGTVNFSIHMFRNVFILMKEYGIFNIPELENSHQF